MKYANGKARAPSVTVTSAASPMVRPMISRYAGSLRMSRKLSRVQTSTICVVNVSMVQKAVISSRTSEVRYIRTNQASGGTSSRTERNHGRRQKRPCSGAAPRFLRSRPAVVTDTSGGALLCGDRSPGRLPLSVRNTGVGAVVAGGDGGLPELDGVEVRAWRVCVVLRAGACLKRLHLGAGLGVDRGLAEEQRLCGLDLRRTHVSGPQVSAVGVRGFGGEHPRIAPTGRAFGRDGVGDGDFAVGLELDGLVRPCGADNDVAVLEERDLITGRGPVLLDQRSLLLEQGDCGVELLLGQLIRVLDAEVGLGLHH